MNDKFKNIKTHLRENAIFYTLGLSLITTTFVIVNYFVTTNLRLTQLANAEVKVEQDEKANDAAHANFVTQTDFKVSLDAIKENLTQINDNVNVIDANVTTLLLRK